MNRINRFFWWCAGANIQILQKCPTDHAKYFGVGGTIVFTALMASFAGGYAFFTAFKSIIPSLFFGAFWGLLIFNLDRYIVSTIGKGDGTQKITKEEWKIAAPRLIMAVLLGFVISTPLELKIFETEIQTVVERLKIDKSEDLKDRDVSFNNEFDELNARLSKVESDISDLTNNKKKLTENAGSYYEERKNELLIDSRQKESELNSIQNKVNSLHGYYIKAINDSLPSSIISSRKSSRNLQINSRNNLRSEKKQIDDQIIALTENKGEAIMNEQQKIDKQITLLITEKESLLDKKQQMEIIRTAKRTNYDNKVENYDGFAAHLEAMSILTSEKSAIFWAKWLLTLLFIFIEVAPVLFKLMAESGPYDDIMDRIKHESAVSEKEKISEINDRINTSIKISTEKNQNRLDAEILGNKALLHKIALAQAEIAELAIEKWKEEEIKKLNVGVNHIINGQAKETSFEAKV
ncbi:DUF4407 domain-containing protein [Cellulophaga sp. HaHa_2_95]|uniref:DUF4407 domain-containing protein n=1 Tax=Cellulophaga sp. HaHa_2_95 TaxID=2745558 RepID=UPI001C501BD6|nr:DUF4407 domain-containing protein [Cellulophaga sp. HaHa_2_95]QXP57158.1 DUF4407 domain-containing protein [Cellulophaga sp. HaHa_2_95]